MKKTTAQWLTEFRSSCNEQDDVLKAYCPICGENMDTDITTSKESAISAACMKASQHLQDAHRESVTDAPEQDESFKALDDILKGRQESRDD